jgi:hypothetical protein
MPTNTSLMAREDETYEQLLTSPDGSLKLWHDKGENPGHKIVYKGETVWFRAPTRYNWRKDRSDSLAMAHAMASDIGVTLAPPVKARPIAITGLARRGPESREHLAMLGRLFGEHVETAYAEEMTPKARPDRGHPTPAQPASEAK